MNARIPQLTGKIVALGSKAKMPGAFVELTAYCRRREYAVSTTETPDILALLPHSTIFHVTCGMRCSTRAFSRPLITVLRPFPGPSPWEARGETSYLAGGVSRERRPAQGR